MEKKITRDLFEVKGSTILFMTDNQAENINEPQLKVNRQCNVHLKEELRNLSNVISYLCVGDNSCNDDDLTELELNRFSQLKVLYVGDHCFKNVKHLVIDGLNQLETIMIGKGSFTLAGTTKPKRSKITRSFQMTSCTRLISMKIGQYSFSDYNRLIMKELECLKSITIGSERNREKSYCFYYTSRVNIVG